MNNFKEDIKSKAAMQRYYRNQRKTVHLVGERTMDPWQAAIAHMVNGVDLYMMYYAYSEIRRGKEATKVIYPFGERDLPRNLIDEIKEKYFPVLEKSTLS